MTRVPTIALLALLAIVGCKDETNDVTRATPRVAAAAPADVSSPAGGRGGGGPVPAPHTEAARMGAVRRIDVTLGQGDAALRAGHSVNPVDPPAPSSAPP